MSDLEAAFLVLVEDETQELAEEFRAQGASEVDDAFIRISVRERRWNREQGRFVVFRLANGSVRMNWIPDPWPGFWEAFDREEQEKTIRHLAGKGHREDAIAAAMGLRAETVRRVLKSQGQCNG